MQYRIRDHAPISRHTVLVILDTGVALKERENVHDEGEETSREIPLHGVTSLVDLLRFT
jgi:hypothetical protein